MGYKNNSVGMLEQLEPRLMLSGDPLTLPHIIDDGGASFAVVGNWAQSTDSGHEGDYLSTSSDADAATWTFTDLTPGYRYRISATWTAGVDRATDAYYTITNHINDETENVLATTVVDQQLAPDDFDDAGTIWEDLGDPFLIRGTTLSIQLSGGTDGSMIADAIRIVRMGEWVAPIGVPTPEFGIEETHWMYADPQYTYDYGSGPEAYKIGEDGPYTHYVDNTHPDATNTDNPFGTPDTPRLTIPTSLGAGSVVEIHGGSYTATAYGKIYIEGSGTPELPIFVRGANGGDKPRLEGTVCLGRYGSSSYVIVENLDVHSFTARSGAHHITIRHSYAQNGGGMGVYGGTADEPVHDIIIYDNLIHDNGDWQSVDENDTHAVCVNRYANTIWIIDNEMYHNGGDSFQVDGLLNSDCHHIYVGRNVMHHEGEDAIDIKESEDIIISQNEMYGFGRAYGPRPGTCFVAHYSPQRIWVLYNNMHDSESGASTSGSEDMYMIGNVIHNILHGVAEGYDPGSVYSTGTAFHSRNSGVVHVENNTIYDVDIGIVTAVTGAVHLVNNIVANVDPDAYHINYYSTTTAANSDMHHNLIYQTGGDLRIKWGGTYTSLAAFQASTGKGEGSVEADPLFIDAADGDFRLKNQSGEVSPAIDAGYSVQNYVDTFYGLYGLDIGMDSDGVSRPQGGVVDMGAFEAVGGAYNHAPSAENLAIAADEDNAVVGTVTATDADEDPLTFSVAASPDHGSVTMNANGAFAYTPEANYYGNDSFIYTVSDGNEGTDTGTVSIAVENVNDAPVAIDDTAQTNSPVTINVLDNDIDIDGDALTVVDFILPAHGDLVYNGDGSFTYTPDAGFCGVDTFAYTVSDGNGGEDVGTVEITVGMAVPFDSGTKVQFVDADGDVVTVSLEGPGSGNLYFPDDGQHDINSIVLSGTTDTSILSISTDSSEVQTTVGDIVINGSLKRLLARTTDLFGDITVTGILGKLQLQDVTGADIDINTSGGAVVGTGDQVSIHLEQVTDSSISTNGLSIKTLRVYEWLDTDGEADLISSTRISRLKVKGSELEGIDGHFQADLVLDGLPPDDVRNSLGRAEIAGNLTDSDWNITGPIGSIFVQDGVANWTLGAEGTVEKMRSLRLGDVTSADVTVSGEIRLVSAKHWLAGSLEADRIRLMRITGRRISDVPGDFGADLVLNGLPPDDVRNSLGRAEIAGSLTDSDWNVSGTIGRIYVRGIVSNWTLGAEGTVERMRSLRLGDVTSAQVAVSGEIRLVSAKRWLAGSLEADRIKSLKITGHETSDMPGDFGADLVLNGLPPDDVRNSLGRAKIAGDLLGVDWDINGDLGRLTVNGTVQASRIRSTGSMGRLTFGATDGSDFLAGIANVVDRHASAEADFVNPLAVIKSVKIRGWEVPEGDIAPRFFENSNFSAATLGTISLLNGGFANDEEFGLFARDIESDDDIMSVGYRNNADESENWNWSPDNGSFEAKDQFVIRIL